MGYLLLNIMTPLDKGSLYGYLFRWRNRHEAKALRCQYWRSNNRHRVGGCQVQNSVYTHEFRLNLGICLCHRTKRRIV